MVRRTGEGGRWSMRATRQGRVALNCRRCQCGVWGGATRAAEDTRVVRCTMHGWRGRLAGPTAASVVVLLRCCCGCARVSTSSDSEAIEAVLKRRAREAMAVVAIRVVPSVRDRTEPVRR